MQAKRVSPEILVVGYYLTQRKEMAEVLAKNPLPSEGNIRGDGDRGDAHDDVRDSHVDQVHAGVGPKVG